VRRDPVPLALRGVLTALVTPFREDGRLDLERFEDLVRWQVDCGIQGLVPCGTTGEGATLLPEEQGELVAAAVAAAAGRVPVVAGCGTNDTPRTIDLARRAVAEGADGLLVVTPYYNKPNRSGMIAHYEAVCASVDRPVVVYNVPGRTGQNLGADLILALARIPGVVGVKEASGNLEQIAAVIGGKPPGFAVLSGDDALALPAVALGADGLISVISNEAPAETAAMIGAALGGDFPLARAVYYRLLPLMRANFVETNPVPVKTAMALLGRSGEAVRPPLGPPEESTREAVRAALESAGIEGARR
jgi:4-hydroxy-tetrahydrodipicolinate synthase